jgi:ubiquinone/menaquinone biosynthesis C-methylase UbiE
LRRTWGIRRGDRVLDIGCGTGQTTREAAHLAEAGSALGVDISATMIERARELAKAGGVRNVTFIHADAAVQRFPSEEFDVAISRFGTMFFADPIAAFANIARSLRHGGRLMMMVWQDAERNEWEVSIRRALAEVPVAVTSPATPDAFSLANPDAIERILEGSGFSDITLTGVQEPVYYGPDIAAALDWVCRFSSTKEALQQMAPADRERAFAALRETLMAHDTGRGVWFDSRAWIVAARRH